MQNKTNLRVNPLATKKCAIGENLRNALFAENYLKAAIIYRATVSTGEEEKTYIGATEQTFKKRFLKHKDSILKESLKSATSLSKYVWELKKKGSSFSIKWSIVKKCALYRCGTRRCDVCLSEKLSILLENKTNSIKKHFELIKKCRHNNKDKLSSV